MCAARDRRIGSGGPGAPALAALAWLALSTPALAQELRGAVVDSATRHPVTGAVIVISDSAGGVLRRVLTTDGGRFRTTVPPNARRLQVLRIGFRPRTLAVAPHEGIAQLDVAMLAIPTMLEPVRVRANALCSNRADRAAAWGLWDQAQAGLLATVVARDVPAAVRRVRFERYSDDDGRFDAQQVKRDSAANAAVPFTAARSAAHFVRYGFTSPDQGATMFYAPDADVLLDDAFGAAYCFHIAPPVPTRPRQIGLAFASATTVRGRIDVAGTLWIDTAARALTELEFRYVGLEREIDNRRPGGRIAFREMETGIVVVDRWTLRLVAPRQVPQPRNSRLRPRFTYVIHEGGGELAKMAWPDGRSWTASLGALRIQAVTSGGAPARGTVIQLDDTDYIATADSTGAIAIGELVPGPYVATVVESALGPLGIGLPTGVRFVADRDSVARFTVRVPTIREFVEDGCRSARTPVAGSARMLGRIMTTDGAPIEDAQWSIHWGGGPDSPAMTVANGRTSPDGLLRVCAGLTPGTPVEIRIRADGYDPAIISVDLLDDIALVPIPMRAERR